MTTRSMESVAAGLPSSKAHREAVTLADAREAVFVLRPDPDAAVSE